MAINVYQAYAGQAIRPTSVGESPARRGQSADTTPAVSQVEAPKGEQVAQTLGGMGPENGLEAVLQTAVDPAVVTRAVEQANAASEAALRAKNRSVQFGYDARSGRVTMTIREKHNGEEVTRQIPPMAFLDMVDRLRGFGEDDALPKGAVLDLDG